MPFARVFRTSGLAANTQDCANGRTDRSLVTADDDDGWGAVAGDVGARGVRDETQVLMGEEILDELRAELALHERVAGDLTDPARTLAALGRAKNCAMNGTVSA